MMGLALWHFTIFLPDHFWAGIVGAFVGAVLGSFIFGFVIHGFTVPGQNDTNLLTRHRGDPGGDASAWAIVYWIGLRQERDAPAVLAACW